MWWVEKLESTNKVILFQNDRPVGNESDVVTFIVAVSAVQGDATGRKIKVSFDDGSSLQLSLDDFSSRDTSLRADLTASDFAKQFAKQFEPKRGYGIRHIAAAGVGGVCALVAAPYVLGAVGFTSAGIAAGTYAAGMMSSAAIANGGAVAAGSLVAGLQSAGAAGLGAAGAAAVSGAGAAAGAGASGLAGAVQNYLRGRAPQTECNWTANDDEDGKEHGGEDDDNYWEWDDDYDSWT